MHTGSGSLDARWFASGLFRHVPSAPCPNSFASFEPIKYAYNIVYLPPALGRYAFERTQVFQSGVLFEFVPTYDLDVGTPLRHEAVPATPAPAHAL